MNSVPNKGLLALENKLHRRHGWKRQRDAAFTAADAYCPLLLAETELALAQAPLAFVASADGRHELVVLLGLRAGENLFVNEKARWRLPFVPAQYSLYPFDVVKAGGDDPHQQVVVFRLDSGLYRENPDPAQDEMRFFDDEGAMTAWTEKQFGMMKQVAVQRRLTRAAVAALAEKALLGPWNLPADPLTPDESTLTGVFRVDEERLNQLSGEDLVALRACGALKLAYSQIASCPRLNHLVNARKEKRARQAAAVPRPATVDHLFGEGAPETIQFNWS